MPQAFIAADAKEGFVGDIHRMLHTSCALEDAACFSNFGLFSCGAGGMASGACDYTAGLPAGVGGEGNGFTLGRCIPDIGDCTPRNNNVTDSEFLPTEFTCNGDFLVVDCNTYTHKPFGFDCTRSGGTCADNVVNGGRCVSLENQPCIVPDDFGTDINPYRCDDGLVCGSAGVCVPAM